MIHVHVRDIHAQKNCTRIKYAIFVTWLSKMEMFKAISVIREQLYRTRR